MTYEDYWAGMFEGLRADEALAAFDLVCDEDAIDEWLAERDRELVADAGEDAPSHAELAAHHARALSALCAAADEWRDMSWIERCDAWSYYSQRGWL